MSSKRILIFFILILSAFLIISSIASFISNRPVVEVEEETSPNLDVVKYLSAADFLGTDRLYLHLSSVASAVHVGENQISFSAFGCKAYVVYLPSEFVELDRATDHHNSVWLKGELNGEIKELFIYGDPQYVGKEPILVPYTISDYVLPASGVEIISHEI